MELHLIPACTSGSRARALACERVLCDAHPAFICISWSFLLALMGPGLCYKQSENKDQTSIFPIAFSQMCLSVLCSFSCFWSQYLSGCISKLILQMSFSRKELEGEGEELAFAEAELACSSLGRVSRLQTGVFPRKFHMSSGTAPSWV